MTENAMILVAIIATVSVLGMCGACWAFAWAGVQRERLMPQVMAQSQESVKLLKKSLQDAHVMLVAHCNQSALIQYADAMAIVQNQDMQPIPGHGVGDPSANGQGVAKALMHSQAKLQELQAQYDAAVGSNRFVGNDDGDLSPRGGANL